MNTRNIKFQYFGMVRQKREGDSWKGLGKFDVITWVNNIKIKDLLRQPLNLGDTKGQVEKIEYSEKEDVWVIRFMKLREDNIPSIAKRNQEAKGIELADDEYIGEDIYMLYDNRVGVAMIQSNRFSLGIKRLSELISHVWGKDEERIAIKPISQDINLKSKRRKYRTIELSFANIQKEELDERSSLSRLKSFYQKFYGISGTIKIGIGRTKNGTLNIDEVEYLIEEVKTDPSIVGARIKVKDDDKAYIETVDLFDNIYNDIIEFKTQEKTVLNPEYVARNMIKYYKDRKNELAGKMIQAK